MSDLQIPDMPDSEREDFSTEESTTRRIQELNSLIENQDVPGLVAFCDDDHPADTADLFEQLSTAERTEVVSMAPQVFTPSVLAELEDEVLEDVLPLLGTRQISETVVELDSDDATRMFEEMEAEQREEVLAVLPTRDREEVVASFTFDDETAGRLMQREFVAAPEFWTVGQTLDHMRAQGEKGEDTLPDLFFNVYVINTHFHPVGFVPLSRLMCSVRTTRLIDIMQASIVKIEQEMDQEDVAYLFEKYDLISAPVIDDGGRLIGMITVDDMVEVIKDENKEDLLALAGVSEAGLTDTVVSTVRARAPWLLVNLITAIVASFVIAYFDTEIQKYVALAVLMPIVASMGGNTGTQALAVAVQALATRDLTAANMTRAVKREAMAALISGVIFAGLMGVITLFWFKSVPLALVIGCALIFNLFCAGLAGIVVPLGLKRVGADPAVASTVIVTTVTDVIGFLAFLGLAAAVLP